MSEADLIRRYFDRSRQRADVALGIGDDAALLTVPPGHELVAAVDTIVEGVHFPTGSDPCDIGYRAMAVNLSDLAAMGAVPAWATLAISLPRADEHWLEAFAEGFFEIAEAHHCALVGGDTVRGPLTVSVQVMGYVEQGTALRRSGARPGDRIYLTHMTGEAAGGLVVIQQQLARSEHTDVLTAKFLRPQPRVSEGRGLRTLASAAMDVSDGLLIDLERLCTSSGVGATLVLQRSLLPMSLRAVFGDERALEFALTGGDDYELLFTAPAHVNVEGVCIGEIIAGVGVTCRFDGTTIAPARRGYDHFAQPGA